MKMPLFGNCEYGGDMCFIGDPTSILTDENWFGILDRTNFLNKYNDFYMPRGIATFFNNDEVTDIITDTTFYLPSKTLAVIELNDIHVDDNELLFKKTFLQTLFKCTDKSINFYENNKLVGLITTLPIVKVIINDDSLELWYKEKQVSHFINKQPRVE